MLNEAGEKYQRLKTSKTWGDCKVTSLKWDSKQIYAKCFKWLFHGHNGITLVWKVSHILWCFVLKCLWKTLKYNLKCHPQWSQSKTQILIHTDSSGLSLSNSIQCGFNTSPVNPESTSRPSRISHQDFRNVWIQSFYKMSQCDSKITAVQRSCKSIQCVSEFPFPAVRAQFPVHVFLSHIDHVEGKCLWHVFKHVCFSPIEPSSFVYMKFLNSFG